MTREEGMGSSGDGERRRGEDRRRPEKRPGLRYFLMGRRSGPRRTEDPRTGTYVEVYGTKIFIASLSLVVLSIADALFTLHHIERGAREMNPTIVLWSQWLGEHLLAKVPYRMITLTVPKRLRPFFLWDRKLLGLLARAAAETITTFYREMTGEPHGVAGIVVSIQTKG